MTKIVTKVSNGFKPATNSVNRINTTSVQSRPLSSQSSLKNKTNEIATNRNLSAKTSSNKSDQSSNDDTRNKCLSNLKGIDKRILDLILDNIYSPNTKIKFNDISGLDVAKRALREIGNYRSL